MVVNGSNPCPTLGAVIVASPKDPLERCLESLVGSVDEILVLTWSRVQARVAHKFGARVMVVKRNGNPCGFRQGSQAALNTDWVLALDPDEYLEPGTSTFLHDLIARTEPDVSGFWLPYAMFFYDQHLEASFPCTSQLRLFKRNKVVYDGSLHGAPVAREGRICHINYKQPILSHMFVDHLIDRFQRHLLWANIEAAELASAGTRLSDPYEIIAMAQLEFEKYFFERDGYRDGVPGLINAVMHAWKSAAVASLLWEATLPRNYQLKAISNWDELVRKLKSLHH
jgi:hypothetical protein